MSRRNVVVAVIMGFVAMGALVATAPRSGRPSTPSRALDRWSIASGPRFEPNRGQSADDVLFVSQVSGAPVELTRRGARVGVVATDGHTARVDLRFAGAQRDTSVHAEGLLPSRSHYYRGSDPRAWIRDVPHFRRIVYERVWPGIDVAFHDDGEDLEYDFVVAPAADADRIALDFPNAEDVRVDAHGDLVLRANGREIRQHAPKLYQEDAGGRRSVEGGFRRRADGRVGFAIGSYDRTRPLVIDPTLIFSTRFNGGRGEADVFGVAMDGAGNVYTCGAEPSDGDGPTRGAYLNKYSPTGLVLWHVQLGGPNGPQDSCAAVTTDGAGNPYITGWAEYWSPQSPNYPTTPNTFMPAPTTYPTTKAFVTKLDPDGDMIFSTLVGGSSGTEAGADIAVDSTGNIYVTGSTTSTDFPVLRAAQPRSGGGTDAFLTAFNPAASALLFSTYLGGSGDDIARRLAIRGPGLPGRITVSGYTTSTDFPVVSATQARYGGGSHDAFVAAYSLSGVPPSVTETPSFVSYLGGSGNDVAAGVGMDGTGAVYVAGWTDSADYPLANATESALTLAGQPDMFLTKLTNTGSGLAYSTYLPVGDGHGGGLAVDTSGNAFVTGGSTFVTKVDASTHNRTYSFSGFGGRSIVTANGQIAIGGTSLDQGSTNIRLFPSRRAAEPYYLYYESIVGWVTKLTDGPNEDPAAQEDSPLITYSGTWVTDNSAPHSGGSARGSAEPGATAVINFFGTGLLVMGYRDDRSGIAAVSGVDSTYPNLSVDMYARPVEPKSVMLALDFGAGAPANHTISIQVTGSHSARSSGSWIWIDGITVLNETPQPRPTATPTPSITRIDDTDPRVSYTGTWFTNTSPNANHSGGSAQLSTDAGSTATLTFTGNAITWIGLKDPWSGTADVFMDGARIATVDTYSATEQDHTPIFAATGLAAGTHTLQIRVTGTHDASAAQSWIWVDAFDVTSSGAPTATATATATPTPSATVTPTVVRSTATPTAAPTVTATPPPATTRVEDTSPSVIFSGSWFAHTNVAESGGSAQLSTDAGDTAALTFTGSGVSWIGLKDAWSGIALVFIDGVQRATVDAYSAADQHRAVLFSIAGLAAGSHTIRIQVTGTHDASSAQSWIWVDAFDVTSGGATATATSTATVRPTATATPRPTSTVTATPTSTAPSAPRRVDDTDPAVVFTGSWFTHVNGAESGGSARLSTDTGDAVTFTFTGTAVSWIGLKDAWSGVANVFVDGRSLGSADCYSATDQHQALIFRVQGLAAGSHTMRIEVTGTHDVNSAQSWIWVDAFDVTS
jgi:limonene-1,2-epoxide hydrolase